MNSPPKPKVLVLDADYGRIEAAIERVLDAFPISWSKKNVVIKPNILSPSAAEKGTTTHPALIRALVTCLRKRGASCAVGDNPGMNGYAANERCARISGILDASDGSFVNFAKEPVRIQVQSRFLKEVVVSRPILEADLLINVPKFKTHVQTRLTGAIKNMFGILVGAEKARVHLSNPKPE
ncbi:MAG TPA: DUF362 domain-containing protein, partial [Candidatus Acidoferrum sp.]|nr:DUF362 domain-containing protein [Candidatus Acidoferrum sp.]